MPRWENKVSDFIHLKDILRFALKCRADFSGDLSAQLYSVPFQILARRKAGDLLLLFAPQQGEQMPFSRAAQYGSPSSARMKRILPSAYAPLQVGRFSCR